MIIYPKTNEVLQGLENLKSYVEKYKGIEIQLLSFNNTQEKTYESIKAVKKEIPQIEEITIHLPIKGGLNNYNFEVLAFSNLEVEKERLRLLLKISQEYNIKINLLYHTRWDFLSWIESGAIDKMKELLEITQNTNVRILIENIYSTVERKECAVLKIAKAIDNEHLKVCLDICHVNVEANMFKIPFDEFINSYLNKEECQKYIHQIHFAGTLNEDGFIDRKTHGRMHDTLDSFEKDYNILKQFGIEDKVIVTEVSEEDYLTRKDQIKEIEMLMNKDNN